MRDDDTDLDELNRLLGHTVEDYRALRHTAELKTPEAVTRRTVPIVRYAVAASVVLALATVVLILSTPSRTSPSRLAMPQVEMPLSLRPTRKATLGLSSTRTRIAIRAKLPRRPKRTRG